MSRNSQFTYEQVESKLNRAISAIERFNSDDVNGILDMDVEDYADFKGYEIVEKPVRNPRPMRVAEQTFEDWVMDISEVAMRKYGAVKVIIIQER